MYVKKKTLILTAIKWPQHLERVFILLPHLLCFRWWIKIANILAGTITRTTNTEATESATINVVDTRTGLSSWKCSSPTSWSVCAATTGSSDDTDSGTLTVVVWCGSVILLTVLRTLFTAFVVAFVAPLWRVGTAVLTEHEKRTF